MKKQQTAGAPDVAPPPYPGQERFYDGSFTASDWTADLALAALDVDADAPVVDKKAAARDAEENASLPPAAFAALRKAGYLA